MRNPVASIINFAAASLFTIVCVLAFVALLAI
jgi:hypothetical protein